MKRIVSVLLAFLAISVKAQVAIVNNLPAFGSTSSVALVTGVIDVSPGANRNWNFSSVNTEVIDTQVVVDPSTLPQRIKDSVPTATYGLRRLVGASDPFQSAYIFMENRSTHYVRVGSKSSGISGVEKSQDTATTFGQTYGSRIVFSNGTGHTYAGYGTLTVKSRMYQSVVMMRLGHTNSSDSIIIFYQFSPQYHMLLYYVKSGMNIHSAYYFEPASTQGGEEAGTARPQIYPNPAASFFTLTLLPGLGGKEPIDIYSVTGKLVKSVAAESSSVQVDVSDLKPGAYFVRGSGLSEKLIIQ